MAESSNFALPELIAQSSISFLVTAKNIESEAPNTLRSEGLTAIDDTSINSI